MAKQTERQALKKQLVSLLTEAQAHITFENAVKGANYDILGKSVEGLPYTIWQLVEHIRIAQEDILDFSRNPDYEERPWPDSYWPKDKAPESPKQWQNSLQQIIDDRNAFIRLLKDAGDLYEPFPHGTGQNMLRETLLIADHSAYHTGQIILLRRILGDY